MLRLSRELDRPWVPAVFLGLAGVVLAVARLHVAGHGNVAAFILPGSNFAAAGKLPAGITTFGPHGYDGQFFYRLALSPNRLSGSVHGIVLDTPYRLERIGYPVLAWLGAAGRTGLVPWSLIGVNVAALAGLGWVGAALAGSFGRHAAWGLVLAGYWGYAYSLSRDTAEIPAAFFLLAGLLALRRSRPVVAGLLLAASVLTRETGMAVVGAVALVTLWHTVRGPRPGRRWVVEQVAWVLPTAAFGAWVLVIRATVGANTFGTDAGANLGVPFLALVRAVHHDLATLGQRQSEIAAVEIAALLVVGSLAAWRGWISRQRPSGSPGSDGAAVDRLAWILVVGLALCLSGAVWSGPSNYRSLDQMWLLDILLLLRARGRLWLPAVLAAGLWALVYVHQVVNL